jgi:cystathionine beta-synthase
VDLRTPAAKLMDTFDKGHVAIVVENGHFHGLITRIDALNHLRRTVAH